MRCLAGQRLDRREIEMVVVIVRQQQHVDRRQAPGRSAGRREALGPERRHRRGMVGEVRVGQDGAAVEADQEARMAEPGQAVGVVLRRLTPPSSASAAGSTWPAGSATSSRARAQATQEEARPVAEVAAALGAAGRIAKAVRGVVPGAAAGAPVIAARAAGERQRQRCQAARQRAARQPERAARRSCRGSMACRARGSCNLHSAAT